MADTTDVVRSQMPLDQVLWECFRHFVMLDESNAAVHVAQTRYSPITFRLAEHLHEMNVYPHLARENDELLSKVVRHLGAYEEDRGR